MEVTFAGDFNKDGYADFMATSSAATTVLSIMGRNTSATTFVPIDMVSAAFPPLLPVPQ